MIKSFVILYPLYDGLIQKSLGNEDRIKELYSKVTYEVLGKCFPEQEAQKQTKRVNRKTIEKNILKKQKVRLGIRFQVFERDGHRCVSCGASAHDGVVLHVDHIQPKSLGGKDDISNYQTLCSDCNLGKSNRSNQDLRRS